MNKFSIIICAYNAKERIKSTLDHLAKLNYPKDHVEIIVVDNNSSDDTYYISSALWLKNNSPFEFKVIVEKKQGLSHARKCGIMQSKYDFILFCDDDNWIQDDYLTISNEILSEKNEIGVLGGQGIPVTDAPELPNWFYTHAGDYATGVQAMESGDISSRGYVWGAASIFRKKLLVNALSSNIEFILTGRNGQSITSGDDSEICKWYLIAGYKLWYDERLVFKHFIPKQRLTREYLFKLHRGFDTAADVLSEYGEWIRINNIRSKGWEMPLSRLIAEFRYKRSQSVFRVSVVSVAKSLQLMVNN